MHCEYELMPVSECEEYSATGILCCKLLGKRLSHHVSEANRKMPAVNVKPSWEMLLSPVLQMCAAATLPNDCGSAVCWLH